jgi:hypothetical protein
LPFPSLSLSPPLPPPPAVAFAAVFVAVAVMAAAIAVAASLLPPLLLFLMPLLVVAFSAHQAAYQLNHQAENVSSFHSWTYFDLLRVNTHLFYL